MGNDQFMKSGSDSATEYVCIDCISGAARIVTVRANDAIVSAGGIVRSNECFIGPGLVDMQVNGINGIDFNTPKLTIDEMVSATRYLLQQGVTTFFPTVITNSDDDVCTILQTIRQACQKHRLVDDCVGGIHLEGPFISPEDGAVGAHNKAFVKAPDHTLLSRFREASGERIRLITLAPEWPGAPDFIRYCRSLGIAVSLGHSMANSGEISAAISAGARLSTHLGNGIPLMLPRHPNAIWDQLAASELHACIIADGIHLPDSFIRVVLKVKPDKTLLVSDATCFAGMPPGEYKSPIGSVVVLDEDQRISVKNSPGLLAGAAKSLLQNVAFMAAQGLAPLSGAWQMASTKVSGFLTENTSYIDSKEDHVVFMQTGADLRVVRVIKNGKIVFASSTA